MGLASKLAVKAMKDLAVKAERPAAFITQRELFPGYEQAHRAERLGRFMEGSVAREPTFNSKDTTLKPPLKLYHATRGDFNKFEVARPTYNSFTLVGNVPTQRHAVFLTEDPAFAEQFVSLPHPTTGQNMYHHDARVMPLHLSAKNPIDLTDDGLSMFDDAEARRLHDDHGISIKDLYYNQDEGSRWENFDGDEGKWFVGALKDAGYDSARLNELYGGRDNSKWAPVWAAFDPRQIKSVYNRGSFDPKDADLFKARGGRIAKLDYRTKLSPKDEARFQVYLHEPHDAYDIGRNDEPTYDLRGWWNAMRAGDPRAQTRISEDDGLLHRDDYWKTPLHPSFSAESRGAGPDAPIWYGNQLVDPRSGFVVHDDAQPYRRGGFAVKRRAR